MARLMVYGAELQTVATGVETDGATQSTPEIVSAGVRSGGFALRINPVAQEWIRHQYLATGGQGNFYFRVPIRVTAVGGATRLLMFWSAGGATVPVLSVRLQTDRTLILFNDEDAAQVGSASVALDLDTYYLLEIHIDTTTLSATVFEARLNGGSAFASGTVDLTAIPAALNKGATGADSVQDYLIDDVAINDGTGSFQNSWPGEGEVIFLRPDGDGDNVDWTGGWADVDEAPPDDATTVLTSNTSGQIEDMNLEATPAALETSDVVNCVLVGHRFNLSNATGVDPNFVLRIKASSGGTVEESAAIGPNATAWRTNLNATPRNYALVLYDLPGASTTAWTKADLDVAQIGVRETVTDTHLVQVTAMWLAVDHRPAAGNTFNEIVAVTAVFPPAVADRLTMLESPALTAVLSPQVAEGLVMLERLQAGPLVFIVAQADVLVPGEGGEVFNETVLATLVLDPSGSLGVLSAAERPLVPVILLPGASDAASLPESPFAAFALVPSAAALLQGIERPQAGPLVVLPTVQDFRSFLETVQTSFSLSPSVQALVVFRDEAQASAVFVVSGLDALIASLNEFPQVAFALLPSSKDALQAVDRPSLSAILVPGAMDSLSMREGPSAAFALLASAVSSLVFQEQPTTTVVLTPAASEALSMQERPGATVVILPSAVALLTGTEVASAPVVLLPSARDVQSMVEKPTVAISSIVILPSVLESIVGAGDEFPTAVFQLVATVVDELVRGPVFRAYGAVVVVSARDGQIVVSGRDSLVTVRKR